MWGGQTGGDDRQETPDDRGVGGEGHVAMVWALRCGRGWPFVTLLSGPATPPCLARGLQIRLVPLWRCAPKGVVRAEASAPFPLLQDVVGAAPTVPPPPGAGCCGGRHQAPLLRTQVRHRPRDQWASARAEAAQDPAGGRGPERAGAAASEVPLDAAARGAACSSRGAAASGNTAAGGSNRSCGAAACSPGSAAEAGRARPRAAAGAGAGSKAARRGR